MKKILLFASMALMASIGSAQVIVYVNAPSANEGNYDFTYAEGTTWSVPDLTLPGNAVTGNMVFCDDGTPADSLACNALVNGPVVTGNVAVLYRGSCEFGLKAFNAQTAGAIAVIIINNESGSPVDMGGGAEGLNVTIPVVMITNTDGALLRDEIIAGNTSVFIGSKSGYYDDDIGFTSGDLLRAKSFSNLQLLSQNDTEFEVEVGSWVRNYGSNNQTGITLNCMIDLNSTNIYNSTSAPFNLNSGDSIFISLPTFSQTTYANGYYEMAYSVAMTPVDESPYDNIQTADFMINDSLWSYVRIDETTLKPINTTNLFNGTTGSMITCMAFQDANASRVGILGLTFSCGTSQNPTPTSLDGEIVEFVVYEWNDVFTDLIEASTTVDFNNIDISMISSAEYVYTSNLQSENIFVPFEDNIVLEDNQRYMFCGTFYPTTYPGFDTKINYFTNDNEYQQPVHMLNLGDQWYTGYIEQDRFPAMSVNFFDATTVSLVELPKSDIVAYPNPANTFINVPLGDVEGNVIVTIIDINGRIVSTQNTVMTSPMLKLDVTTLPTGMYTLRLAYENGTSDAIQVVVNR